ncbi:3-deoxy-7-phosphoheptulonate synthase [Thioalkalivibrio denitrificans]|uniref:Phospho-2-dehydro-3-deoxyheptonate aldolase n=1 Tax=Thioalkalivibrio denitrificans TaxID=108003 RepID=A0A1V3NNT1_9GAMM|nr:3-deoxy-7-phosphoheptulonate synthase AroG [Thioalkalivibrio denitrificans]OOG26482.1 3-deoxy-7-phosphoheptulonate synthase [Thioalkalivibrio denitrificans]
MRYQTDDLRILEIREVSPPVLVHEELPITDEAAATVHDARMDIHNILAGQDDRLLVIAGPCSIHDVDAAMEYAGRLKHMRDELIDDLHIVMRVYFEKPRTTVGWKGLINDPNLDGSFQINKGLRLARGLLLDLAKMGMPAGTEYLDLISPQYVADLVAWGAIGARTTESQVHRELASGLSCPVGFKNSTDGSLQVAVDAIRSASRPHHFLSVTKAGHSAIFSTAGNTDCHIILRGGKEPNFDADSIEHAATRLKSAGLPASLMVDCSHANSRKDPARQVEVARVLGEQVAGGDRRIIGVMLESHLVAGRQDVSRDKELTYGQSITDACMSWEDTRQVLTELAAAVRSRREAA